MAEAGFYTIVDLLNGTTRKEAKSMRFAKMDQAEFDELYKASFNVIWNHILFGYFENQAEAEQGETVKALNTALEKERAA